MSITLDDLSSLLHLLINGRLFDHSIMTRPQAHDMMMTYLGPDPADALKELYDNRWVHARFSFLENLHTHTHHLVAAVEADGDNVNIVHHSACTLRSYLMYLVGMSIFVERVSHSYTTLDAQGDPPSPANQEILEEKQAREDHNVDVLPVCHCIMDLARAGIDRGDFPEGIISNNSQSSHGF